MIINKHIEKMVEAGYIHPWLFFSFICDLQHVLSHFFLFFSQYLKTLTRMGMATSLKRSLKASRTTFLTSASLMTSTKTSKSSQNDLSTDVPYRLASHVCLSPKGMAELAERRWSSILPRPTPCWTVKWVLCTHSLPWTATSPQSASSAQALWVCLYILIH